MTPVLLTLKCVIEEEGKKRLIKKDLVRTCQRKQDRRDRQLSHIDKEVKKRLSNIGNETNESLPTNLFNSNSTSNPNITLLDICKDFFGYDMSHWQVKAAKEVVSHKNETTLLVRPTGQGKSLVRDVSTLFLCGVTLTFTPLLVLACDQKAKSKKKIRNI